MKTKYLIIGMGFLVAAAGWAGSLAWRVHRQLVTLNVREMPLRQVLSKIEWQTWKKIRAERALDARITLHVKNMPLRFVLDRIAMQAGARWSTIYAVYTSADARRSLDQALAGDGKLDPAGWSQLAPRATDFGGTEGSREPRVFRRPVPQAGSSPEATGQPGPGGMMMFGRNGPGGVMVSRNGNGQTEVWSPEALLTESSLTNRFGTDAEQEPTAHAAEEAAHKVHGKWTTYLALRQSIMGIGFAGPSAGRPGANPFRHNTNEQFARLTAEQRVQRARQRRTFQTMEFEQTRVFEKPQGEK